LYICAVLNVMIFAFLLIFISQIAAPTPTVW
jgi:hypothetical protein